MVELVRADALYQQLAKVVREEISKGTDGEYPAGSMLPSEATLAERYKVSRPTVRLALNTLRAEGLIAVRMGKGSFVRTGADAEAVTIARTAADAGTFTATGEPAQRRAPAGPRIAALLGVPVDAPTFVQDETGTVDGRPAMRRTILPFAVAEGTPLATDPFPGRAAMLSALRQAHGKQPSGFLTLSATEYVRARMPQPEETAALQLSDVTPILETTRITFAAGRPLLAEVTTTSAEGVQYAYQLS